MSEEKNALRDAAIEAISDMAQHLPLDCELLLVACRPGKKDFDLVLPSPESNSNNALGAQNSNPPPSAHWATRF